MRLQQLRKILRMILLLLSLGTMVQTTLAAQDSVVNNVDDSRSIDRRVFDPQEAAVVAMTLSDYPVTPGDLYNVSYQAGSELETIGIVVEHDYTINLGPYGEVDGYGLNFVTVRDTIRQRIVDVYPRSTPRITIQAIGQFQVVVSGEVEETGIVQTNGLRRLQDVVADHRTERASIRNVTVVGRDGTEQQYDLFKFSRDGDLSQNPYLRPGDRIQLGPADRIVTLRGEIYREGSYQLQPGENLRELIEQYGNGTTDEADLERIEIVRRPSDPQDTSRSLLVEDLSSTLRDGDEVILPPKDEFLPVAEFEGAIFAGTNSNTEVREGVDSPTSGYARYTHRFRPGDRLSKALREVSERFLPAADLDNAYLTRTMEAGGEVIAINIEELLYNRTPSINPELRSGDRIMIPFNQRFVTVTGGVQSPGRIAYVPGRSYRYYLAQAGGTNPGRHWGRRPRIHAMDGDRRNVSEEIQPEDRIHFATNSPLYYIGPLATAVSLVTSVINVYLLVN